MSNDRPKHGGHNHDGHQHAYVHAPMDMGRAVAVGIILYLCFVIVEAAYGLLANSMALVADAGHNLGDVLGLVVAWIATVLARGSPSQTHTYGLKRGTILAALINAVLLLIVVGAIMVEAFHRLVKSKEVAGVTVMVVAAVGIVINGLTACLFFAGRKGDLNLRGAYLHMVYDALVSLDVVVAGGAILLTGWTWLDPVVSLLIAAVIMAGTWGLLKGSVGMSLDAMPSGLTLGEVGMFLKQQSGVSEIHDLHI